MPRIKKTFFAPEIVLNMLKQVDVQLSYVDLAVLQEPVFQVVYAQLHGALDELICLYKKEITDTVHIIH